MSSSEKLLLSPEDFKIFYDASVETEDIKVSELLGHSHSELIEFRDKIYNNFKSKYNLNECSNSVRIVPIATVVTFAFNKIDPQNRYYQNTDIDHFKEVSYLSARYWQESYPDLDVPLTLTVSSWFHDIERFIPETRRNELKPAQNDINIENPETDKNRTLSNFNVDKLRKEYLHPYMSAKVAETLLQGAPITKQELNTILDMILHHEKPFKKPIIVNDYEIIQKLPPNWDKTSLKLLELDKLIEADAVAFFESTINVFIPEYAKKKDRQYAWNRVISNVKRLNRERQPYAVKKILQLSENDYYRQYFPDNWEKDLEQFKPEISETKSSSKTSETTDQRSKQEIHLKNLLESIKV